VAVINIEIPHILGQVVDVVTTKLICSTNGGAPTDLAVMSNGGVASSPRDEAFEFLIRGPAFKLVSLYLAQVRKR
jgi:hypothetical protein